MLRATARPVCGFLAQALERHEAPEEILTDNGKIFTNRFGLKPTEVLFDKIWRERHHPPAHRSGLADDDRQDRAVPPHLASGILGRADLPLLTHRPKGTRHPGAQLQHRSSPPGNCYVHAGPMLLDRNGGNYP
jgi:hypothetical protein